MSKKTNKTDEGALEVMTLCLTKDMRSAVRAASTAKGVSDCAHDFEELIDPNSGGWVRCRICGKSVDCEGQD